MHEELDLLSLIGRFETADVKLLAFHDSKLTLNLPQL